MSTVKRALKDVVETMAEAGTFQTFQSALRAAGLLESLKAAGPFTVLAPTDKAFSKVSEAVLRDWLRPEVRAKLKSILAYHVVPGRLLAGEMMKSSSLKSLQGTSLTIHFSESRMHVNNANVERMDISCDNGVIHVIDTVLLPR